MNKKITTALISSIIMTANAAIADYSYVNPEDFTNDAFYTPPVQEMHAEETNKLKKREGTMPPIKKLRVLINNKRIENAQKNSQLAPTNPENSIYQSDKNISEYASKELEENFDENMMPDGFEADEESVQENKKRHFWNKKSKNEIAEKPENTENIILDCENMDYDTDKFCLYARGNVNVEFVKQETVIKADVITYDRANNTIKAEGNVKILKNGQTITGDYIFVDMNEENALIEKPVAETTALEIRAEKGYVYGDKIVQEKGTMVVDKPFPINFQSGNRGPQVYNMITPKNQTWTEDMSKGLIRIDAKNIKVKEKGDLEVIAVKNLKLKKGKHTILKVPGLKIYTNRHNDYVETNSWEIGSVRGMGMYIGPGFVFELPKGSVLKAMPVLNYKNRIGVGGIGRFSSGTNQTRFGYGTAASKFIVQGKQKLDDNLSLHYSVNDYIDEGFLGRRRPKYGVDLVYEKSYTSDNFLIKGQASRFGHRADIGYFHNIDQDKYFKELGGSNLGTLRTRYMAEASQNLFSYINEDKQKSLNLSIVSQLSAALYGTGDTQFIGRIGPNLHTQYRRWMQDIGFMQAVYSDHTPMPAFDAYRYGKSSVYAMEYLRICRFLTLSWFGSINVSNDAPTSKDFQNNAFFISIGPDDFKLNFGYDFVRETTFFTFAVMMDAMGANVNYDKLEIKQDKNAKKSQDLVEKQPENNFRNSEKAPVLERAVVEDVKTVEDVL